MLEDLIVMVLAATTNTFVGVQHDPAFKRISGRNYRRQYPTKLPERILPDECVPFDEEWR